MPSFRQIAALAALSILPLLYAAPAVAAGLDTCDSEAIAQRFGEFGRTGRMPADLGRWLSDPKGQFIEPYRAFDNVYYVGVCWVSAYVIKTDEGAILLDTLHDPFTDLLVENIRKAGVDPKDIKVVLMTHGHYDHAGGAYRIRALAPQARFMMTQSGWDEALASAKASRGTPRQWTMIPQDKVVKSGDVIRLGGQEVTVLETPGHTYGTASYVLQVKDGSRTYRAVMVGGLGLNAIRDSKQVEAYIASIDQLAGRMANPATAFQVHLTTHPFSNDQTEAARKLKDRAPGAPHPLVDPDGISRQLAELRAGAVARLAVEKQAGR